MGGSSGRTKVELFATYMPVVVDCVSLERMNGYII